MDWPSRRPLRQIHFGKKRSLTETELRVEVSKALICWFHKCSLTFFGCPLLSVLHLRSNLHFPLTCKSLPLDSRQHYLSFSRVFPTPLPFLLFVYLSLLLAFLKILYASLLPQDSFWHSWICSKHLWPSQNFHLPISLSNNLCFSPMLSPSIQPSKKIATLRFLSLMCPWNIT